MVQRELLAPDVLFVEAENAFVDSDMGTNAITFVTKRELWVCKAATCARLTVAMAEELDRLFEGDGTPPEDIYGKIGERRWSLDWNVEQDGTVVLKEKEGPLPKGVASLVGRLPFDALVTKTGVVENIDL